VGFVAAASCNERKDIIARMMRWISCLLILCTGTVYGAVRHVPIRSGVVLQPGQAYTAEVASAKPVEIGWTGVQAKPCTMDCVQLKLLSGDYHVPFAARFGAQGTYTPTAGRVVVEYRNISQQAVTIDVFRIERTCEAEACKLFDPNKKGSLLVFKIAEFKSITNSSDGSYSVISGVAESGRAFRVSAIWWTDQKGGFMSCARFIKGYVDNHTPKEKYAPYILSGMNVGEGNSLVLKSIDDCVPSAPHFGVLSEKSVFK